MKAIYAWPSIIFSFVIGTVVGLFVGFLICLLLVGMLTIFRPWWNSEFEAVANLLLFIALLASPVLGVMSGIQFARGEMQDQRETREARHLCVRCSYPLTGIRKTSDRCPECGESFRKP